MRLTRSELKATEEKIAEINERAQKRGWTGRLEVVVDGELDVFHTYEGGFQGSVHYYDVRILGEAPCYDGWTFLARLEWEESGVVTHTAPGVEGIDRDSLVEGACDHCKTNRYRKHTFIVRHEDGRQLQVGSTCIKDFLGWDGRPVWIDPDSYSEDRLREGFTVSQSFPVETVLAIAWAAVEQYGYVRTNEIGLTTKDVVSSFLIWGEGKRNHPEVAERSKAANEMAGKIRDWILSDEFFGDSEYVLNLKTIAEGKSCSERNLGILVSATVCYNRYLEKKIREAQERSELDNSWTGNVKDKIEIDVTVKFTRFFDNQYGGTTLYTMIGSDNRVYKWFSSKGLSVTFDGGTRGVWEGDTFTLKGTIKDHDEWNGQKQTVLTRCKVIAHSIEGVSEIW